MASTPSDPLASVMNPFLDHVVKDAWQQLPSDVTAIHAEPFRRCLEVIQSAELNRGYGVLLHGEPGAGKTHLLARLRTHLAETASKAADKALRCIFVSVRLSTHASELWQHLRRRLAEDLHRRIEGLSQFQRLIAHQVAALRKEKPRHWVMAMRVLSEHDRETIADHAETVANELELDPSLSAIVRRLATGDRTRDAYAWLRGDPLSADALKSLGLPEPDDSEPRAVMAQRIVTSLCRLAGDRLPIVFCFDQIEALEPNDRTSLAEFGRMAAELIDSDPNVAVISSVQSSYLETLDDAIRQAHRDRVFRVRAVLDPLDDTEVVELLASKLQASEELQSLRALAGNNRLYPFDDRVVRELTELPQRNPRRVLSRAAERFDELRHGPRPAAAAKVPGPPSGAGLDEFLTAAIDNRRQRTTVAARELYLHGLPILAALARNDVDAAAGLPRSSNLKTSAPPTRDIDAVIATPRGEVALVVLDQTDMRATWRPLDRVLSAVGSGKLDAKSVLVVRPASQPIPTKATATLSRLEQLRAAGGRFLEPSLEAMAALDALRTLVSDARAGDLNEGSGKALDPRTVVDWLRKMREDDLAALADAFGLSSSDAPKPAPVQDHLSRLRSAMAEHRLAAAADIAVELGIAEEAVVALAAQHPDYVGLLGGPPAVLFDIVGARQTIDSEVAL